MQSIKNIYEKIYDFENLHKAWEEARKGKRYRDDVLIFNRNYEEQLINIQNHLIYETYEVQRLPKVVRMRGTDRREKQPKRKLRQYPNY